MLKFRLMFYLLIFLSSLAHSERYGYERDHMTFFPDICQFSELNKPLRGHWSRIGIIRYVEAEGRTAFFFLDQRVPDLLQMVPIATNAGIIGENIGGKPINTQRGSFVVGHIFVGDSNISPAVTCYSEPISQAKYEQQTYESTYWEYDWLNRYDLIKWLQEDNYTEWKQDKWSDELAYLRSSYLGFRADDWLDIWFPQDKERTLDRNNRKDKRQDWRWWRDKYLRKINKRDVAN